VLDGVTPFPAEFAARYRALGYWEDRPQFDGFRAALAAHANRVAVTTRRARSRTGSSASGPSVSL